MRKETKDVLKKFKTYIQTRIETIECYIQYFQDNSMNKYYNGRKDSLEEVVKEINFLLGEDER